MKLLQLLEGKLKNYDPALEREVLEQTICIIPEEKYNSFYAECLEESKGYLTLSVIFSIAKNYKTETMKYIYTESQKLARVTALKLGLLLRQLHSKFGANMLKELKPLSAYEFANDTKVFTAIELKAFAEIEPDEQKFIKEAFWALDKVERLLVAFYEGLGEKKYISLPLQKLVEAKRIPQQNKAIA